LTYIAFGIAARSESPLTNVTLGVTTRSEPPADNITFCVAVAPHAPQKTFRVSIPVRSDLTSIEIFELIQIQDEGYPFPLRTGFTAFLAFFAFGTTCCHLRTSREAFRS
jgi:hypothetical protein